MGRGLGQAQGVTVCLPAFLQSVFINRPALGILPPENFVEKLRESLLSVSFGELPAVVGAPPLSSPTEQLSDLLEAVPAGDGVD